MRAILASLSLFACSEYDLANKDATPEPGTTQTGGTTTATTPPGECGALDAPAISVPLNEACDVPPQTGTFTPVVEWELSGYNAYGPPVVGQLDDDNGDGVIDATDTPDIVYLPNDYSGLLAVDGKTGKRKWQSQAATDGVSGVAIGDVDGDGIPEIAAANGPTTVVLMDNVGNKKWSTGGLDNAGLFDFLYPSIADLDGDGQAEIIAGRVILSNKGKILGTGSKGVGAVPNASGYYIEGSVSVPADLDGDGVQEVVVGNAAYNMDGSLKYSNNLPDGCPAVADFDLDGEPEVVMVTGGTVYTLESDLTPTGWSYTFPNTNYVGPPSIDDLDGDGAPDFVVVGSNKMKGFTWAGNPLWTAAVTDSSGAAGAILFDFELDGYPEVVYADEQDVRIFNGLDGTIKLDSTDHSSYTGFETPIVADVDNDGHVEIVMLHGGPLAHGITVYGDADDSWPAGRQVWNQHAYTITNVGDDLAIPQAPTPNWDLYNNFRSGDAGLPPSAWNDLLAEVVETCVVECPGELTILARVWNEGTEAVPAGVNLVVRAGRAGPVVGTGTVGAPIPSGMSSEGVAITVKVADLAGEKPWVDVDRDAADLEAVVECDEANNDAKVADTCP